MVMQILLYFYLSSNLFWEKGNVKSWLTNY